MRYDAQGAVASVPSGARAWVDGREVAERAIALAEGSQVAIGIGTFTVKLGLAPEERCAPGAPLAELRESGGYIAGSALMHAAIFAAIALFAPALSAAEEDAFDQDRLALMQRLLDASAQHEVERPAEEAPDDAPSGGSNAGAPAAGAEGASGKPDTNKSGRWAAKGDAKPEDATLAREHALAEASTLGAIGALNSLFATSADAPVVPWGTTQNGSDAVDKVGLLFGGTIDDGRGSGGLGLSGPAQGGGGTANAIGMTGMGGLGHTGKCLGDGPCEGTAVGRGHPGGGHTSRFKGPRYAEPTVNGRLDPEVIRRVVRLNDGRYRACYQAGLVANPGLAGRVSVKFLIDRSGAVGLAADGGSDLPDENVRRCVVSSFVSLSFPAPENGAVSVIYPIVFSPE